MKLDCCYGPHSVEYIASVDRFSLLELLKSPVGHEEGLDLLFLIQRLTASTSEATPLIRTCSFFFSPAILPSTDSAIRFLTSSDSLHSRKLRTRVASQICSSKDTIAFFQLLIDKLVRMSVLDNNDDLAQTHYLFLPDATML